MSGVLICKPCRDGNHDAGLGHKPQRGRFFTLCSCECVPPVETNVVLLAAHRPVDNSSS